ncbi:hypothetical protein [Bacillus wiedmannii]|nr:hypothetical protein [Bacillus wiedmannii]
MCGATPSLSKGLERLKALVEELNNLELEVVVHEVKQELKQEVKQEED